MDATRRTQLASAVAGWLDRVRANRGDAGYAGPVAHWWRDSLIDCRPGYDWRYEGTIAGYLDLYRATRDRQWLDRARRDGDDVLAALEPTGLLRSSRFELNPGSGGTPHEAAAATGLLRLARDLAASDRAAAAAYCAGARRIIDLGQVGRLWDGAIGRFRDDPARPSFVPNKAGTLIEALALLAEQTGESAYVDRYLVPSAEAVVAHQVRRRQDRLDGAIAQNSWGTQIVARYFPYYVARCIPGLLEASRVTGQARFAEAALAAGRFVVRTREPDGGFPQVIYEDGLTTRFPRWAAATGDVLRALEQLQPFGLDVDLAATRDWLARSVLAGGQVMTARGFAAQGENRAREPETELRDLLPVAGWADKAFRYFAAGVTPASAGDLRAAQGASNDPIELGCVFRGRALRLRLDSIGVTATERGRVVYRLANGASWPEIAEPWIAIR